MDYDITEEDEEKRFVPDTSAIIEGTIKKILDNDDLIYPEIIIPEAVIAELEHQANNSRPTGFTGLNNLKELQKLSQIQYLNIHFTGRRPNTSEIIDARKGEVDALIRDVARDENAILVTSDKVQAETAEAQGLNVIYNAQKYHGDKDLKIMEFFTSDTMSVHLKENVPAFAKKGTPGHIELVQISENKISYNDLENFAEEILEKASNDKRTYLEADLKGAIVVQSKDLRISITRPPFSEAMEITAVRPVAEVSLEDYNISEDLLNRISKGDHGILISGSPGAGKSTFAQALATYFSQNMGKVVKTMESPRDLQVPDEITQYSPLEGDMEKTADILLLVRPDVTIYDELRKSYDFQIFADMRLAGVGMVGVVHATKPIDAIQRITNRVELGVIPSIVDTTIFIDEGHIDSVYETRMTVKVPSGMQEQDLARPVIEVRDLLTGDLKNEIYTYGEQTIVIDVEQVGKKGSDEDESSSVELIAEKQIIRDVKKVIPGAHIEAKIISPNRVRVSVPNEYRPKIIGRGGKRIDELERKIGIGISVETLNEGSNEDLRVPCQVNKKGVNLEFPKDNTGSSFDIFVGDDYLFTATVGKSGLIRLRRGLELTDILLDAIDENIGIFARRRND
ncbi:PINc/VapC family ATPase [Methanobrevibacter sp. UBA313]|uniref:PINc/VapC family ATPase n=1 Tax=Methanobrevibacter sp. UBA313 TaxID=1915477 RepID=UPI0039B95522